MKRTLEEEEIPTHVRTDAVSDLQLCATPVDTTGAKANLERTITMPIAADVWIGHIIPRLSALSILSLQLTCHDGAFLVEKSVMKYNDPLLDKSEKEYHIPLFREIKETDQDGGRSDIIMQILSSGTSLVQLEWFIDWEFRSLTTEWYRHFRGHFVEENYGKDFLPPILNHIMSCVVSFNRMDFVRNFKFLFINNLHAPLTRYKFQLIGGFVVDKFKFVGGFTVNGHKKAIISWSLWKNFLCWLVKEAEVSLLLELMKGLDIRIELVENTLDGPFAKDHLFSLLLLRDNEDLLDVYLDPHSRYTKNLEGTAKYIIENYKDIYEGWLVWGNIERFCKSERIFIWCQKNLPPPGFVFGRKVCSTFQEVLQHQALEFAKNPGTPSIGICEKSWGSF